MAIGSAPPVPWNLSGTLFRRKEEQGSNNSHSNTNLVLILHVHVVLPVPVLLVFFNINGTGPNFHILATIQAAWAANRGHFWYFILATVHPE